jgi:ariadne-2
MKARHDLERYLHYFERFDNHSKSLKLEEELRAKIIAKIEQKVADHEGTWIDWQYLHDAASLLTKCRYTLEYTYPFAFYLEAGQRKELFEYQQAQLEKEIEELSWKVERAESTDRADLEKQMHVAECKRRTLLQDFLS